jgi:integrase
MTKEIETFLSGFEKPSTQRIYRGHLNTFFENIKADPKTYFKDGRDYQQDLLDFWLSLKEYAPCTRSGKITAIRQFMEENDVIIARKTWNIIKRQKKAIPRNIDHVPTPQELKSILTHGGLKEKALFLVMASSGIRIDEALSITLNDINLTDERGTIISPAMIKIRQEISKNDTPRITFMSDEARDILFEWLKIRGEYLNAAVKRLAKLHIEKKLNDDRVFPYAWATAWNMWSRMLHKSKLDKRNKSTPKNIGRDRFEIHIHTLRKFMMNRMKGVTRIDAVEQLAGHEGYLDRAYRRLEESELTKAYQQGMQSVTIFSNTPDLSSINESLKEKDDEIAKMRADIEKMHNEILTLQNLETLAKLLKRT